MKKLVGLLVGCLALQLNGLEYVQQFENDQVVVGKVVIAPYEEIGLHCDVHSHLVIGIKGGTITRIEPDGSLTDVVFPTGETVFRKADFVEHRSVNNSAESIELIIIQLKNGNVSDEKRRDGTHDIAVNVKINCPDSAELNDFVKSVPKAGNYNTENYEEWKTSFINNMNCLIHLVDSEKVYNSFWSVKTDLDGAESK